jgi:hypothetical protein
MGSPERVSEYVGEAAVEQVAEGLGKVGNFAEAAPQGSHGDLRGSRPLFSL